MFKTLLEKPGLKRYGWNALWLLTDKALRLTAALLVGVWVARYLGPEKFGVFSYVLAFVGMLAPLGKLGLDGIISRNVAQNETDITQLLSNSALLKFLGGAALVLIAVVYMSLAKNDPLYVYLSVPISLVVVVKSFEVIEFYFRAKVRSISIAAANSLGLILGASLKVSFIIAGLPIIYFAFANLLDAIIAATFLLLFFRKEGYRLDLKKVNVGKAISLTRESWPLMFGSFFAVVYLNVDQIMIGEMLTSYHVGQYSAAVRISSIWYIFPMTIGWAIQTAVVNAKKTSESLYYERLQDLFTVMAMLAYLIIIPITYFSQDIINIFFGEEYSSSGDVLSLHIWSALFVFVGSIRGLWIINESYYRFVLFANIGAGLVNVLLNYLWLPKFGIIGAAWATLLSYGFTYVVSGFLFRPASRIAWMQMKSILLLDAIGFLVRKKWAQDGK
ncbi:flippase [Marinobacter nauticus]